MRTKDFKSFIALILVVCMSFMMVGCGSKATETVEDILETQVQATETTVSTSVTETEAETPETFAPATEAPVTASETPHMTPVVTEEPTSTTAPTETPATETPTTSEPEASMATATVEPTATVQSTATPQPVTTDTTDDDLSDIAGDDSGDLTPTQKNAINMLNYMTVLMQEINDSQESRIFLDNAYNSLINNIYPNAVNTKTQNRINTLLNTLYSFQMISVKRERLEYIYEQNQAQALREAIPSPVALLSAVQSGSLLKAAASVLYMAVDSVSSYNSASTQADLEYLQDGWELDDEAAQAVHENRTNAFNYMIETVNEYGLPGDYALTENAVEDFVDWKNKTNLIRKISWFESNEETYAMYGPYWLELAKDYYENEDYQGCLDAVEKYEEIATRIFRKDTDYAEVLPMAILSAKEEMTIVQYDKYADEYTQIILKNTDDWAIRYFVAQIYLDLYRDTKDKSYLDDAYQIAFENVNELADEQKELNSDYLKDIKEVKAEDGATKQQKADVKQYNKMLKETRKVELPPVSEALYLNCDLLFALIDECGITANEQKKIDAILHENGESIFLTTALGERFSFDNDSTAFDVDAVEVEFNGVGLSLPVTCVSARSTVTVTVTNASGTTTFDEWKVKEVERPKNADCSEFVATYTCSAAKKYDFAAGDIISIIIVPVEESPEEVLTFTFEAVQVKKVFVFSDITFERK